jgi:preprotein translocase subunit SecE
VAKNPSLQSRVGQQAARRAFSFRFFGETLAELRRVTWPTREETTRLTIMVISVAAMIGLFLGVIDVAFARLFEVLIGS